MRQFFQITKGSCTAKAKGLARMALVLFFLAPWPAFGQDILIRSDEESGTEIRVGSERHIHISSDPENGTEMYVNPPGRTEQRSRAVPIIITPEIKIQAK